MNTAKTDLSKYDNGWYKPGGSRLKRFLWYYTNALFFLCPLFPFNFLKIFLLRLFGASVGKRVTIKPGINIKYPWLLNIGNYVWIGENVWIDNLAKISIAGNACISQGALLLTGNHDYTRPSFDLTVKEIIIEEGVWIGAKAVVCPGVNCKSHSVLAAASVATKDLEPYSVYGGSPAVKIKERLLSDVPPPTHMSDENARQHNNLKLEA